MANRILDEELEKAVIAGDLALMKNLVSQGANIHRHDDRLLADAAAEGHLEIVKYLVDMGLDTKADDCFALEMALQYGFKDVALYLIEKGGKQDLDVVASNGYGVYMASSDGSVDTVSILMDAGANPFVPYENAGLYYTPGEGAIFHPNSIYYSIINEKDEIAAHYLSLPILNQADFNAISQFCEEASLGSKEVYETCLSHEFDLYAFKRNKVNATPIVKGARHGME